MFLFIYQIIGTTMTDQIHTWNYTKADSPIIMSVPHCGTKLSASVEGTLTKSALRLVDTDWHMDKISTAAARSSASVLFAQYSRYMIDLNRPQDDKPLYASATTGLVPTIDFDGNPLYLAGHEPDEQEFRTRIEKYWTGYHQKLRQEIQTTKSKFGFCLLLDCHSIRSKVPRLFDGTLPDINIGTNNGVTTSNCLSARITEVCEHSSYSYVVNGRFKGGYITRRYGDPASGVHAVQIEIAQSTYMTEAEPWTMIPSKADCLTEFISNIVAQMQEFASDLSNQKEIVR